MTRQRKIGVASRAFAMFLAIVMVCASISFPSKAEAIAQTIGAWDYQNQESAPAELPAGATTGSGQLSVTGASYTAYSSKSLAATAWEEEGYWLLSDVNAANYDRLTFSASLRSSKTGPKDFRVEYSLDEGASWNAVAGSEVEITSTDLQPLYKDLELPAELSGKSFELRVKKVGNTSVNGDTVASTGVSNINQIEIKGFPTENGGETAETCAEVKASVESGVIEPGTAVEISCETEGAEIYYKMDDAERFTKYESAIIIEKSTTITAYSTKEGLTDSKQKVFEYTVKEAASEPEATNEKRLTELKDGDVFVVYNPANKKIMSSTVSGTRLTALDGQPLEEDVLSAPDGSAVFTASYDAETGYYQFKAQGKYLTSDQDGGNLTLEKEANNYSLWNVEKADEQGGFFLKNVNAEYGGNKNQYIEFYSGSFTTFGKKEGADTSLFLMNFYPAKEGVQVEAETILNVAQWAGNANYEEAGVEGSIFGDLYQTNDMLNGEATYQAFVSGKEVLPYTKTKSTATDSTSYYMGGSGFGSGSQDYLQFVVSSKGYGKMGLSFRLRSSNTGAGSYQLQYSVDGNKFKNFEKGSYSYKYTSYDSSGQSSEVNKSGDITDGIAKTSYAPGEYIQFKFDVPAGAENAEKLYIRLAAGEDRADGKDGKPGATGTLRMDSVTLTGSPVVAADLCGYVKADPASGEATTGTEITMTSATEGVVIHYSIDGGEYQVYDADHKPVLDKLPANVRAYASKDGMSDSIKILYQYTSGKVKTPEASPNGGAVLKNTEVTLKCATEGATIYYSADSGATWQEYTDKIVLSELPMTYKVKAVKEGYEDSSIATISYTERTSEKYNLYFGQLHSHTSYSDGSGTAEQAYQHASGVENLDFLALTDHSNSFDNADSASIADGSMSSEWTEGHQLAEKYTTQDFVGLFGFEMTWSNGLGHINTFNSEGFQSRTQSQYSTYNTALQNYYATLKTAPQSISQFNHPGTTFGDFSDFAYYDEEIDKLITTIEVGNGEGAIGSSGYFPSYEYYQRALDKGWHVAPTNNQDNHKGLWGDANTARSVVMADSLTEDNIYDAMRNYRVYATEDNDLSIYYTLDNYEMGTILSKDQTGDTVTLKAELSDKTDASIGKVQVITNGGLVLEEKNVSTSEETVEFQVKNDYSYYYLKVTESDGDIAVTAPVWVREVEAAGINSISTTEVLPVKGQSLPVTLELYNNENSDMQINSISFSADGEVVHEADLEQNNLTSVPSMGTAAYTFDYTHDKVGNMELNVEVQATLNGAQKVYKGVLKLTYVTPEMVTKVVIDGTHYNDYVTGYYGGNVGNFTKMVGDKNVKVEVVKDEITSETLESCSLLIISAPAKKSGTANAGEYKTSHFSDEFINTVKDYTDRGGTLIVCGIADYQDSTECQTATEMNKLLNAIGATTTLNSDEAYDETNNGGQPYRLYLKNYNKDSSYLKGAVEGQEYSAYSGCTVNLNPDAVSAGTAEALISGYDTTYSIDCKDENGNTVSGSPTVVEKGNMVTLAHEKLSGGADVFVSGTVFISDFEVKAEQDNNWDLPYLNKTIVDNILDQVTVELETTPIEKVRKEGTPGDVFAVEGYVTAGTSNENNKFFDAIYVQDDTAGITVFPYSEAGLEVGTKLKITGYVDAYQGDKEIQVIKAEKIPDDTHVYDPEVLSAKDAMNYDTNGGKLVQISGKVTRVIYSDDKTGVSQFWLDDGSGEEGNVFIDGYITSGTTGKNELASIVKEGAEISAVGIVYAHPEGESDTPVTCLRVRNCDEIKQADAQEITVDKSALLSEINAAPEKPESSYTEESWAAYAEALEKAQKVYADEAASQEDVDQALSELKQAKEGLKEKEDSNSDGEQNQGETDQPDGNQSQNGSGSSNGNQNQNTTDESDKDSENQVVKTGDDQPIMLYFGLLAAASVAAVYAGKRRKKLKN